MINRTLIAGRVTRAPYLNPETGCCCLELVASHEQAPDEEGREQPPLEVSLEVLVPSRRQAEVLRRWVERDRHLFVSGHLAPPAAGFTRLILEQWEFLPEELSSVDLAAEARRQVAAERQAA